MPDTTTIPIGENGRRALHFHTLDDMLADVRACIAAEHAHRLARRGNWTIGQAINHIAAWIEYPFLGYPPELVIPPDMQSLARAHKDRILREPMRPGEKLPGLDNIGGTFATEVVPAAIALPRLEAAAARLRSGQPHMPCPLPDPAFGVVTHHEWTEMTLRHAELHLSFFAPA